MCLIYIILRIKKETRRYLKIFFSVQKFLILILTVVIATMVIVRKEESFHNTFQNNENLEIRAVVKTYPNQDEYSNKYIIEANKKKYILYTPKSVQFEYGDIVVLNGIFQNVRSFKNPGGFNYAKSLKKKNIYGTIKLNKHIKIGKKNTWYGIFARINNIFKRKINDNFDDSKTSGILIALLLGDKSNVEDKIRESINENGLAHILAISGMHIGCINIIFQYLLNVFLKDKRKKKIIIIIILIVFGLIIGFMPSAERAIIMAVLVIGAKLVNRKSNDIVSINLASLIILVYNPYYLFDSGFLLSFGATIGIVCLFPRINKFKFKNSFVKYLVESFLLSISINILIFPIMIYFFKKISISFIFTGLILSPLVLVIEIFGVLILFSPKALISVYGTFVKFLINIFIKISEINIAKFFLKVPSLLEIILYYLLFLLIMSCRSRKILKDFIKMLIIVVIASIILQLGIESLKTEMYIYFVDIGQGDCTLVVTPGKHTVLIDGGGDENYDIGRNVLVPYLLFKKIDKIDYIIVSHFDTDHVGGLLTVMEELKVENVVISRQGEDSENYRKFREIVEKKKIKVQIVEQGDRLKIENDAYLDILWPNNENLISDNALNNNSIVCKLSYKDFSMLFTGDIEEKAEKQILNEYKNNLEILKSTIIKVAHHGSKTSSTKEFIEAVKPEIALIGVGENNTFGHPDINVLERLTKCGAKIYRTDKMGEITIIVSRNKKIKIKEYS